MIPKVSLIAAAVFLLASPAFGQSGTVESDELPQSAEQAEALYSELRSAYEAALLCRALEPTEEDRAELAALLNEKTRGQVMPGIQLSRIDAARREVASKHKSEGCDGPRMSELLGIYDAQLSAIF